MERCTQLSAENLNTHTAKVTCASVTARKAAWVFKVSDEVDVTKRPRRPNAVAQRDLHDLLTPFSSLADYPVQLARRFRRSPSQI
eukprot:4661249-Pleurochrysis_carterae.AAC.4